MGFGSSFLFLRNIESDKSLVLDVSIPVPIPLSDFSRLDDACWYASGMRWRSCLSIKILLPGFHTGEAFWILWNSFPYSHLTKSSTTMSFGDSKKKESS